ncbi:MAG: LuxR C-terminal-related transcriptional regulator [Dehalococcoidia bacterium]
MNCPHCRAPELRRGTTDTCSYTEGRLVLLRNLPADICDQCGYTATDFPGALRNLHQRGIPPSRCALALVYDPNEPPTPNPLAPKEMEILGMVTQGSQNKAIAGVLGTTEQTVKNYVSGILKKLGAVSRSQAVFIAVKRGWIDLGEE